jgi:hypothetical protein
MYDNNNASKANDFSLSENIRLLGILCIAREDNAIVVEIKIGENGANDLFVIRMAIDFKDWNSFIKISKVTY